MADKPKQTAQEKAQQAVEVAQRKYDKVTAKIEAVRAEGEALVTEQTALKANLDYLKQHPALTQPTTVSQDEQAAADLVEAGAEAPETSSRPGVTDEF